MQIDTSSIQMASQQKMVQQRSSSMSMRMWIGDTPPPAQELPPNTERIRIPPPRPEQGDQVDISPEARRMLHGSGGPKGAKHTSGPKEAADYFSDPVMRMVVMLMEKVLGEKFKVYDIEGEAEQAKTQAEANGKEIAEASQPPRQGWGVEIFMQESYYESESMQFAAEGVINTKDGQAIRFQLGLSMSREYFTQQSVLISMGDALQDPLVVNFDGNAAQLSNQRFQFDLNNDGVDEELPTLGTGSGFLALDKNGDGKITQGRELFGPNSGDGFTDLAVHDEDGNGWIDSGDSVYDKLRLMVQEQDKQQLYTLKEKGVGAIYLNAADTPFTIKDNENQTLGQVARSSIYVNEQGDVGSVQRVDLAT